MTRGLHLIQWMGAGMVALALAGCAANQAPDAAPVKTTVNSSAPLLPSMLFAGTAERFQGWHCTPANQHLVSATNAQDLRLWSLHGAWRLPQAVVASGARYQNGKISFWNRGEQAMVETPRGQLQCTLGEQRKGLTRSEKPGVMFFGQGNEPGWTVALAHDAPTMKMAFDYDDERIELPYIISVMDNDAGRVVLENARVEPFFRLRIEAAACFDTLSGQPFPSRVTLSYGGEQYSGCGQGIAP
ncbi:MliC family protein [Halomonas aquamarina]|uniref:MliC family protein n=1 Tax=Vreelandella aquamarina TaxID=77097 RepID=A0ACC5VU62_9GAMM|nr:MliC family protein [Halomonas aquamarina]MBZ5487074.1 MliC family protein [Halomonas aquamarina]